MKPFKIDQTQTAIKLLKDAYNAIGMAKYELGEDWDKGKENSLEGQIGGFLQDIEKRDKEPELRITIGKKNCINDTILYLDVTLPEINTKLQNTFADQNYEAMKAQVERLKRVVKDLDDMVNELSLPNIIN